MRGRSKGREGEKAARGEKEEGEEDAAMEREKEEEGRKKRGKEEEGEYVNEVICIMRRPWFSF